MRSYGLSLTGITVLLITSCASQPYAFQDQVQAGDFAGAEKTLEKLYTGKRNTVLHNFYDASLKQLKGDFEASNRILEETKPLADQLALISISETAAAATVSESLQSFSGSQFERLMIYCHKFLNYMALRDYNSARIETEQAELKLREWRRSLKDFPFIPFLNALAYEAQGLTDNALVSYRRALEAYDGHAPQIVKQSYLNLLAKDNRVSELRSQEQVLGMKAQYSPQHPASVVIFVADGIVSARTAGTLDYADPKLARSFFISVPIYSDFHPSVSPPSVSVNQSDINSQLIVNIEAKMREALAEQMPGFIARGVSRAITRSQAKQQINENSSLAILFHIAGAVTEIATADTRSWDVLPQAIFIARAELPAEEISLRARVTGTAASSLSYQITLRPGFNFFFIQAR